MYIQYKPKSGMFALGRGEVPTTDPEEIPEGTVLIPIGENGQVNVSIQDATELKTVVGYIIEYELAPGERELLVSTHTDLWSLFLKVPSGATISVVQAILETDLDGTPFFISV